MNPKELDAAKREYGARIRGFKSHEKTQCDGYVPKYCRGNCPKECQFLPGLVAKLEERKLPEGFRL